MVDAAGRVRVVGDNGGCGGVFSGDVRVDDGNIAAGGSGVECVDSVWEARLGILVGANARVERGDLKETIAERGQPEAHWKENFWKDAMAH